MAHNHSLCTQNCAESKENLSNVLIVSMTVNFLYVIIETLVGISENSLGLLSDAGHNMGDVFSLALTLLAVKLAQIPPTSRFTYGYKKSTILVSVINSLILIAAVAVIIVESISRINSPSEVNGLAVTWTAVIGIVINGITAWILMKHQKNDINVRGAFMHMLADTLVSLGVVLSGILISFTGWDIIDIVVSLSVSVMILYSTFKLLYEGVVLLMDGVPLFVDETKIRNLILETDGVMQVSKLYIRAVSTTENAVVVHIVIGDISLMSKIKRHIRELMRNEGIDNCTIEVEVDSNV